MFTCMCTCVHLNTYKYISVNVYMYRENAFTVGSPSVLPAYRIENVDSGYISPNTYFRNITDTPRVHLTNLLGTSHP